MPSEMMQQESPSMKIPYPRLLLNFLTNFLQLVCRNYIQDPFWFFIVHSSCNVVLLESDKETLNTSKKWLMETLETVQVIAHSCGVVPTGE